MMGTFLKSFDMEFFVLIVRAHPDTAPVARD